MPSRSALAKEIVARIESFRSEAAMLLDLPLAAERHASFAYEAERARLVQEQLARIPLRALNKVAGGRLRLGAMESAGLCTVADIWASDHDRLESIYGVGIGTSERAIEAARQVGTSLRRSVRVRFDVDAKPTGQTDLLKSLRVLEALRARIEPLRARIEPAIRAVAADIEPARLEYRWIRRFFATRRRKEQGRAAFERLVVFLSSTQVMELRFDMERVAERLKDLGDTASAVWGDYAERSGAYNELLAEVSGQGSGKAREVASQGFVPEEVVDLIRAFDLRTDLLDASLRGYQSFGAKFALVQRRTILGDEMGLGKTIEALAVICHLCSNGATHFLVVSPASVLVNWEHEIGRHSQLECIRLHGVDRDRNLRRWARRGGVAVTTFDTLGALRVPISIEAMVVDEAHYVKNPAAFRTQAVISWLERSRYVVLMSGTPMQNRVDEFRALVEHIRPDLARTISAVDGIAGADAFRMAVAPVYLRRNQADVLDELPPRIETAQWLTLWGASADSYRRAVADGNFMAMRQAAFVTERPEDSPKLVRLMEIVEEAADNDRKVVVFSYFRDVIRRVHSAVGPLAMGPLTGQVPASLRQTLVDRFSELRGPAVLISQIEAGGVGLNIQAASVVILTEPQWKPATEEQAIARCHRMGQIRPVEVHRLLVENSVDERMFVTLARKSALFAEYARGSAMKEAAPEAVDVVDHESMEELLSQVLREMIARKSPESALSAEPARGNFMEEAVSGAVDVTDYERVEAVLSQAEQERRIIELERRRLGIDR